MRKFIIALLLLLTAVGLVSAQESVNTRTFESLDRGLGYSFDYPIDTHSVRTSNLQQPTDMDVVFGGLIAVEPNDSYLYADDAQPGYLTRMRVLVDTEVAVDENVDLAALAGTLPLIQYDASELTVQEITLGGQPAVRVDGIPVVPGEGATEIITYFDGLIYEIVIEAFPLGLGFNPDEEVVIDPVYDDILNSWVFTSAAG